MLLGKPLALDLPWDKIGRDFWCGKSNLIHKLRLLLSYSPAGGMPTILREEPLA